MKRKGEKGRKEKNLTMNSRIGSRILAHTRQRMVAGGASSSASKKRNISTTIFIKGLPPSCTTHTLRKELEPQFGGIRHAIVFEQPENIQKTNAMVDFHELDSALAAQDELDQNYFMDKRVDVEFPLRERTRRDQLFQTEKEKLKRAKKRRNDTKGGEGSREERLNVQNSDGVEDEVTDAGEDQSDMHAETDGDTNDTTTSSSQIS